MRWQRNGGELPLRGDLIRRCAPPSPCAGKALTNQRASRRRRDKGLDAGAFFATSSDIRLAWDRRMPPSPQGEGFGESQPACVLPQAGQEAEYQSSLRHLIRHPPRGGSADATFSSRRRLWRIPTSVRPEQTTPHPSSASREIGGCHLLLKEKALVFPVPCKVNGNAGGLTGLISLY